MIQVTIPFSYENLPISSIPPYQVDTNVAMNGRSVNFLPTNKYENSLDFDLVLKPIYKIDIKNIITIILIDDISKIDSLILFRFPLGSHS